MKKRYNRGLNEGFEKEMARKLEQDFEPREGDT